MPSPNFQTSLGCYFSVFHTLKGENYKGYKLHGLIMPKNAYKRCFLASMQGSRKISVVVYFFLYSTQYSRCKAHRWKLVDMFSSSCESARLPWDSTFLHLSRFTIAHWVGSVPLVGGKYSHTTYLPCTWQTWEITVPPKSPCNSKICKPLIYRAGNRKVRIRGNTDVSACSSSSGRLLILLQSLRILSIPSLKWEIHYFPQWFITRLDT